MPTFSGVVRRRGQLRKKLGRHALAIDPTLPHSTLSLLFSSPRMCLSCPSRLEPDFSTRQGRVMPFRVPAELQ